MLTHLRAVETYLDAPTKLQPAACYMRDFLSDYHFWSPEVFQWFGLPIAEQAPPPDQFFARITIQHRAKMRAAVQRHVEDGGRFVCEYCVRQPGGMIKHFRSIGQTIPSRSGHGSAVMGTLFDLTEYRRARGALRKAFKMLLNFDSLPGEAPPTPRSHSERDAVFAEGRPNDPSKIDATRRFVVTAGGLSARQFARVCELIKIRSRERLTVNELAAAAGVSTAHFARAFKQTTGRSPHRFILEQRLEQARRALVLSSDGKLANIAIDFGFFDQSHFTRHFRRKFGITPSDFLRQSTTLA